MITMLCCGRTFENVEESTVLHPVPADECRANQEPNERDILTADMDELSRPDVADDAWIDEIMGIYASEDWS